jgi:hypothetical protein
LSQPKAYTCVHNSSLDFDRFLWEFMALFDWFASNINLLNRVIQPNLYSCLWDHNWMSLSKFHNSDMDFECMVSLSINSKLKKIHGSSFACNIIVHNYWRYTLKLYICLCHFYWDHCSRQILHAFWLNNGPLWK